jgi:hypothetical protein
VTAFPPEADLSRLTISGGSTTCKGGGLTNLGGMSTLTNRTVSGNSATGINVRYDTDGGGLMPTARKARFTSKGFLAQPR